MFRVILYRDPDTDPLWNEGAPTAQEIVVPAAWLEEDYLVLRFGSVDVQIRIPTCGDVYFNGWNATRVEIEEIE